MTEETQVEEIQEEIGISKGVAAKMVAAMGAIEKLPKNGRNEHYKYAYVTDEDVMEHMRKVFASIGIAMIVNIEEVIRDIPGRIVVWLGITLVDPDSGEVSTIRWPGEADSSTKDKAINIAITAGIKYFLLKTFLVSTGDESTDGDSGNQKPQKKSIAMASKKQRDEIVSKMKGLGTTNINKALNARGFSNLEKLTGMQAKTVIQRLEALIKERETKEEPKKEEPPSESPQEDPF